MYDAIDRMPALVDNVELAISRHGERMAARRFRSEIPDASVASALIFVRDAVYFFNGSGVLTSVESNYQRDPDPSKPGDQPELKFRLPSEEIILVSEPKTGRTWRVFAVLGAPKPGDGTDDEEEQVVGLDLHLSDNKPNLPIGLDRGELVISIYKPASLASREPDIPQPGWKTKEGADKPEKEKSPQGDDTPKWASAQYEALLRALAAVYAQSNEEGSDDVHGTGTGRTGSGQGGGGTGAGIGTAQTGTGQGGATSQGGSGRGRDGETPTKAGRPRPDKVAVWNGPRGPMINVHAGGTAVAIPMRQGEDPNDLAKRVLAAVAKLTSTGKRLAGGATETGCSDRARQARSLRYSSEPRRRRPTRRSRLPISDRHAGWLRS